MYKLSYSSISTWLACPYKFYKQYVTYEYKEVSAAADRGSDIHKEIEDFITGATEQRPSVEPLGGLLDNLRKIYGDPDSPLLLHVEHPMAVDASGKFCQYKDKDAVLRGKLDAIIANKIDRSVKIIDWKSGKMWDYSMQGKVYGALIMSTTPAPESVKVMFNHLEKGCQPVQTVSDTDVQEVWNVIDKIQNCKEFNAAYNDKCKWCKMKGCRYAGM